MTLAIRYRSNAGKSNTVTYGISGKPGLSVTYRQSREPKNVMGGKLVNVVNEIVINADVPVEVCGKSNICSTETLSARIRFSGSTSNAERMKALRDMLLKLPLDQACFEGFTQETVSVDVSGEVATIYAFY